MLSRFESLNLSSIPFLGRQQEAARLQRLLCPGRTQVRSRHDGWINGTTPSSTWNECRFRKWLRWCSGTGNGYWCEGPNLCKRQDGGLFLVDSSFNRPSLSILAVFLIRRRLSSSKMCISSSSWSASWLESESNSTHLEFSCNVPSVSDRIKSL